jgi:hypothetical protein
LVSLKTQAAVSKTKFEVQTKQWRNILINIIYIQSLREVQFNNPFAQPKKSKAISITDVVALN